MFGPARTIAIATMTITMHATGMRMRSCITWVGAEQ